MLSDFEKSVLFEFEQKVAPKATDEKLQQIAKTKPANIFESEKIKIAKSELEKRKAASEEKAAEEKAAATQSPFIALANWDS